MRTLQITNNLNNNAGKITGVAEKVDYNDLYNSFKLNWQLNSAYEISFTATYTQEYKDAWNMLKMKRYLYFDGQFYTIQQLTSGVDENGLPTMQVTANASLIDMMKNVRLDPKQPTEDNPESSGGGSRSDSDSGDPQPGIIVKRTDEKTTYTLQNRLDQFFGNNDQGIKYELHGNFPQAAVDCSGSLYEWLGTNLPLFGAFYVPDNYTLKIYDLESLRQPTDKQYRYLHNVTKVDIQSDSNEMYNDFDVFGGKMEKDITTAGGTGGSLDNVEDFCKSPINADFGVDKNTMIDSFASRSQRVKAWGVDVNRLYDIIKNAGVSPEWFFAYELQEQGTYYGWLNHTYKHGDAYQDAQSVCEWIKATSQSDNLNPAWSAPEGSMAPRPDLAAKWNQEFGKGSIGRVYLQGTAAATWDLAGTTPNPSIGKPITGCVNVIRSWGGHTVTNAGGDNSWGWPFPSVGEGNFSSGQLFGVQPGGGFRTNGFHDGLDFGSIDHPGSEVHAIHGGTVTTAPTWGGNEIKWYLVITDSTGLNVEYQEAFGNSNNIIVGYGQQVQTGQVIGYRTTDHLHIGITRMNVHDAFSHAFLNDGTWLDPQAMIKNGGDGQGSGSNAGDSTSTTTQTYYALHYHYSDENSIKQFGLHRGPQVVVDSIYDMTALQKYVEDSVAHEPPTSITNNEIGESDFHLGDTSRIIVPEQNINQQMTLMGIEYNPFNPDADASLTWNNTGLAMKDSIYAMYQDIRAINRNVDQIDYFGATGARQEDHFSNINSTQGGMKFSEQQAQRMKAFTNGTRSD